MSAVNGSAVGSIKVGTLVFNRDPATGKLVSTKKDGHHGDRQQPGLQRQRSGAGQHRHPRPHGLGRNIEIQQIKERQTIYRMIRR